MLDAGRGDLEGEGLEVLARGDRARHELAADVGSPYDLDLGEFVGTEDVELDGTNTDHVGIEDGELAALR